MPAYALRIGWRKYSDFPDGDRLCESLSGAKLFDLVADPEERSNLTDAHEAERWAAAVSE